MLVARLEVLGDVDDRGSIRFKIETPTTLRDDEGAPIDVLIDNFSRTGFLFLSDGEFPAGTLVAIGLSGAGTREAQVIWRDGNRHGCEFLVPLPQSKMARAFRGQEAVLSDLEEQLRARLLKPEVGAEVEGDVAVESKPDPVSVSPARSLSERLAATVKRLFPSS